MSLISCFTKDDKTDSAVTEKIWKSNGFFGNQRTDLKIAKANFPDNTLIYLNNDSISAAKGGKQQFIWTMLFWSRYYQLLTLLIAWATISMKIMKTYFTFLHIISKMVYIEG